MKFVYAEKLYTDIESQKEFSKILRKLTWNRSVKGLFLVTESLSRCRNSGNLSGCRTHATLLQEDEKEFESLGLFEVQTRSCSAYLRYPE